MKAPSRLVEIARNQEISEVHQAVSEVLHLSSFCLELVTEYHTKLAELKALANATDGESELARAVLDAQVHSCNSDSVQFGNATLSLFANNLFPERIPQDQLLPSMKEQLKNWRLKFSQTFIGLQAEVVSDPETPSKPSPTLANRSDGVAQASDTGTLITFEADESDSEQSESPEKQNGLPRPKSLEEFLELEKELEQAEAEGKLQVLSPKAPEQPALRSLNSETQMLALSLATTDVDINEIERSLTDQAKQLGTNHDDSSSIHSMITPRGGSNRRATAGYNRPVPSPRRFSQLPQPTTTSHERVGAESSSSSRLSLVDRQSINKGPQLQRQNSNTSVHSNMSTSSRNSTASNGLRLRQQLSGGSATSIPLRVAPQVSAQRVTPRGRVPRAIKSDNPSSPEVSLEVAAPAPVTRNPSNVSVGSNRLTPSMPPPRLRPSSDRVGLSGGSKIRPVIPAEPQAVVTDQNELPVVQSATIALKTAKLSLTHQNWRQILNGLDLVRSLLVQHPAQVKPHSREILAYLGNLLDNGSLAKPAASAAIRCCQEYAAALPSEFEKHAKHLITKVASKYSHGDPVFKAEAHKALDSFSRYLSIRLVVDVIQQLEDGTASRMCVGILTEGLLEYRSRDLHEDETLVLDVVISHLLEDPSEEVRDTAKIAKQKLDDVLRQ